MKANLKMFAIKKIEGKGIKGISNKWVFEWPRISDQKNQVTIILGDNGSGKSSIISLIEFCLQARNGSWLNKANKEIDALFNVTSDPSCYVKIETTNNVIYERSASKSSKYTTIKPPMADKDFSVSPFVLRRYDITRFIEQDPESRQVVLWEYLSRSSKIQNQEILEKNLESLKKQIETMEIEIKEILISISNQCSLHINDIPTNPHQLRRLIEQYTPFGKQNSGGKKIDWRLIKNYYKYDDLRKKLREKKQEREKILKQIKMPVSLNIEVQDALRKASEWITRNFLENSTIEIIKSIQINLKDSKSLDISLILKENKEYDKKLVNPYVVLSEANVDLLALLFYLALIRESANRGQPKVICLDDIFQSVDKVIRLRVLKLIAKEFSDWEIIITTHDRSWSEAIRSAFSALKVGVKHIELDHFDPLKGPIIAKYCGLLTEHLNKAILVRDVPAMRGLVAIVLEQCCNNLSMSLNSSIKRRPGDRYTIGDLWPSINKILNKSSIGVDCETLNSFLFLRNYAIAHYNESASDISDVEIHDFSKSVYNFINHVYCNSCSTYLSQVQKSLLKCRCGKLKIDLF